VEVIAVAKDKRKREVVVKDSGDYADVFFDGNRVGSVELLHYYGKEPEWMVFTNAFDTNRVVIDKNTGIAYLEALIALARTD